MANYNYVNIKINEELLRRIENLERKVDDLQTRNQKLENIMRDSFIGFKFNNQKYETDGMRQFNAIRDILNRI